MVNYFFSLTIKFQLKYIFFKNLGTMYKYRFSSYKLAKEWYAHFKLAINLHERLKPENLIKFD